MADIHSKQTRSYNMSKIKGKNTKPELLVRKFLFANGFRYKLHGNTPSLEKEGVGGGRFGKPDIILPKYKTVIFVHGCFWHGHKNCKYATIPKTRTVWWTAKLNRNKELDKLHNAALKKAGWKIITVWECELKPKKVDKTLLKLSTKIC